MKRILLFGATGGTGQCILTYALEQGYAVTALVRNPAKLTLRSPKMSIIEGTPTDPGDVDKAMANCDIVISALSPLEKGAVFTFKKLHAPHTLETSIRNAITSMNKAGKKRIIVVSAIGAGDSYRYAPWYVRLLIRYTNYKIIYDGHNGQEALLMRSDLDWTIARPAGLTDDTDLKKLVISYNKTLSPFTISRKLLAKYIVDSIEDDDAIKKAPMLSER
jgi:putative NADH-flavin reductase